VEESSTGTDATGELLLGGGKSREKKKVRNYESEYRIFTDTWGKKRWKTLENTNGKRKVIEN